MEELLKLLEELYVEKNNSFYYDDGVDLFIAEGWLYNKIIWLCNWKLIIAETDEYNMDNINILRNNGYDIFKFKMDEINQDTICLRKNGDNRMLCIFTCGLGLK